MKRSPSVRAAIAAGLLLTSSCAPRPPAQSTTAPIRTDRSRYVLRPGPFGEEATIVATFSAPADSAVYIVHCNGAISWGLQRQLGNEWKDAWGAETNGCLSAPIVVPAGGLHADTLTIVSRILPGPDPGPVRHVIPPGAYRVVWHNLLTSFDPNARPLGRELSVERRVSVPITIARDTMPE